MYLHADKTDLVIEFIKQIIMVFMCACLRLQVFITIMLTCKIFRMSLFFGIGSKMCLSCGECFCFVIVQKRNFVVHFCKLLKFVLLQIKIDKNRYFRSIQMCPIENLCTIFLKKKVVISICKCVQRIDQIQSISDRIEKFNSKIFQLNQ